MRQRLVLSICLLISLPKVAAIVVVGLLTASTAFARQDVTQQDVIETIASCKCESADSDVAASQSVQVKNCVGFQTICVAPQDEVWLVPVRQQCGLNGTATKFYPRQLINSQWQTKSVAELAACHQSDPDHMTIIVIHGNNTPERWALTRGMQFYERVFGQAPHNRPAIRMVLLAWESEKVLPRPAPDYQLKSARAAALGPGVGSFLNELGGSRPVLVGYSLGVQVVLSTLSNLAACEGADLSECAAGFEVAMIAPALDADFACRGLEAIPHNPLIEDAEIFLNRHDRVARAARVLNRKQCADRTVESSVSELANRGRFDARFQVHDVTREVSSRHSLVNYVRSTTMQCRIREMVARAASQRMGVVAEVSGAEPLIVDVESDDADLVVPLLVEPMQR